MPEGEWHAFRPIRHIMLGEYTPAAPQQPTFFEQQEIEARNYARLVGRLGNRALRPAPEDDEGVPRGFIPDEDILYLRFNDDY